MNNGNKDGEMLSEYVKMKYEKMLTVCVRKRYTKISNGVMETKYREVCMLACV